MILIGERINAGFKDIANAIRTKDPTAVEKWAVAQAEAGATYLDVNIGAASRDPADMAWLVETVQKAVPTKISVDSTKIEAIEAGLDAIDGRGVLVNSTTADPGKLEKIIPLAVKHEAMLLGLAMDERGSPQNVERRVENGAMVFMAATEAGIPPERIVLDPILMPIKFMQEQVPNVLEAIEQYTHLSDPPPHISVGLSNIGSKTAERGRIVRTFLVMAMARGLDAAILDVCDEETIAAVATAELMLNQEIYSDSYIRAFRIKAGGSA
ncbi:MAG: dihydropteroate synthase [Candidatus Bipolaricaulota bacterium]|nr:MAG: dihydropteroate synthase [Candidatus Bipolaricaulota bacterium]